MAPLPARLFFFPAAACLVFLLSCCPPAGMSLVGGRRDRLASDAEIQKAAAFAMDAFNEASNSLCYFKMSRIQKAQSQVVAGIKYYLTIEVVMTVCEKRGNPGLKQVDLEHCSVASGSEQKKQVCDFQVWSRQWLNNTQLLNMNCTPVTDHDASK